MATTDEESSRIYERAAGFRTEPQDVLETVESVDLPESVAMVADDYDRSIGIRDRFVWKWIYALLPAFTLDCVDPDAAATVREQKTVLTILVTTLDDIAEHEKDKTTFEEARKLLLSNGAVDRADPDADADTLEFVSRVWTDFEEEFTAAPRYDAFIDLFRYDLDQTIDAIAYSWLVSEHPTMANLEGACQDGLHNMVMFPYADVDLSYSSEFEATDLSALRRTIWDLERMARIGNWVSTWERELRDRDYSSGILVAALDEGIVTPDELACSSSDTDELVERIRDSDLETRFLGEWIDLYTRVQSRELCARSVDLETLTQGMRTVLRYHLATKGYK